MVPSGYFILNSPDVVTEDFDGIPVILNLADGRYFSLVGIGSDLWKMVTAGFNPEALFNSVAAVRSDLADSTARFLTDLLDYQLVRLDGTREGKTIVESNWNGNAPELLVFSDLMELIYSDPIHDVDNELNWPAQPTLIADPS